MSGDSKRFYDLVYEAWRTGRDSDAVSRDRFDDYRAQGYYPDEISLSMVYPKPKVEPEPEQEWPEPEWPEEEP